jgi:hypothetical protein
VTAPDHFVQFCAEQVAGDHLPRLHHRILHTNPSISMPINQSIHKEVQRCAEQVTGDHLPRLHHRILHINPSISTSINQYISKSSFVQNRLLVIISPGCTMGFCTSIHQSEHQSINTLASPVLCGSDYW